MRQPQFRYNPKTLRYEQVKFSIWRALGSFIAYGCFGVLFFVGLNLMQNFFIESPLESSLSKENNALSTYKTVLNTQLISSNVVLAGLKADEAKLHNHLFEVSGEPQSEVVEEFAPQIAADVDWDESMQLLENRFSSLLSKTKTKNTIFGERLRMEKEDIPMLLNLPTISPVKEINSQNLVSGFGVRINPFHKGNYHHDGIDIALPKGTEVYSTGNGHVVSINFSHVEAGFGNSIEIDHGNGIFTRYAHLDKINVTWGQKVKQGQVIGLSGSSGGSVAPHLHYEITKLGKNQDPLSYIIEGISADRHQQLALKNKKQNQSLD